MKWPNRRTLAIAVAIGCGIGAVVGLIERSGRGPTGMGAGPESAARIYAIGSQPGGHGWITIFQEGQEAPIAALQVPWKEYDDAIGSAEVVAARLGNRRAQKLVVGLGAMPGQHGGWVVILDDVARGCSPIRWLHVGSPNDPPLATHVATGDIDGDGRDEIVVGVSASPGQGGKAYVFNDLRGHFAPLATLSVPWSACAKKGVETRPAVGDLDGDGKAEVVLGLGKADEGGWMAVFKDLKFHCWVRYPDAQYNRLCGGTWPACGDMDGTGKADLLVGTDEGGRGRVAVISDVLGRTFVSWMRVPWEKYDILPGEARPQCVSARADGRKQALLVLRDGTRATRLAALLDDSSTGHRFLGWRNGWSRAMVQAQVRSKRVDPAREARDAALQALRSRVPGGVGALRSSQDGTVSTLIGRLLPKSADSPLDQAKQFLSQNLGIWGLTILDKDIAYSKADSIIDPHPGGSSSIAFRQVVSGVPLVGGELLVRLDGDGSVRQVSGHIDPEAAGLTLDPAPRISSERVAGIVAGDVGGSLISTSKPELRAWVKDGRARLVWQITSSALDPRRAQAYLVDANSGEVLTRTRMSAGDTQEVDDAGKGTTFRGNQVDLRVTHLLGAHGDLGYLLKDVSRVPSGGPWITVSEAHGFTEGIILAAMEGAGRVTVIQNPDALFDDHDRCAPGVTALHNMKKILHFWDTRLNRNSFNGAGGQVKMYVNVLQGGTLDQATGESGGVVLIGQPDMADLDILAHEFTHCVAFSVWNNAFNVVNMSTAISGEDAAIQEHLADAMSCFTEMEEGSETTEFYGSQMTPLEREDRAWTFHDERDTPTPGTRGAGIVHGTREFGPRCAKNHLLSPAVLDRADAHNSGHDELLGHFLYLWARGTHRYEGRRHPISRRRVLGLFPNVPGAIPGVWALNVPPPNIFPNEAAARRFLELVYKQLILGKQYQLGSGFRGFQLAVLEAARQLGGNDQRPTDQALLAFSAIGMEPLAVISTVAIGGGSVDNTPAAIQKRLKAFRTHVHARAQASPNPDGSMPDFPDDIPVGDSSDTPTEVPPLAAQPIEAESVEDLFEKSIVHATVRLVNPTPETLKGVYIGDPAQGDTDGLILGHYIGRGEDLHYTSWYQDHDKIVIPPDGYADVKIDFWTDARFDHLRFGIHVPSFVKGLDVFDFEVHFNAHPTRIPMKNISYDFVWQPYPRSGFYKAVLCVYDAQGNIIKDYDADKHIRNSHPVGDIQHVVALDAGVDIQDSNHGYATVDDHEPGTHWQPDDVEWAVQDSIRIVRDSVAPDGTPVHEDHESKDGLASWPLRTRRDGKVISENVPEGQNPWPDMPGVTISWHTVHRPGGTGQYVDDYAQQKAETERRIQEVRDLPISGLVSDFDPDDFDYSAMDYADEAMRESAAVQASEAATADAIAQAQGNPWDDSEDWASVQAQLPKPEEQGRPTSSPPTILSPAPGSTLTSAAAAFTWIGDDKGLYWIDIGSSPGESDLYESGEIIGTSAHVTGLPTDGSTLNVSLYYFTPDNQWLSVDATYTASGSATVAVPAAVVVTSPASGSTLPGTTTLFQWTSGIPVKEYWLSVYSPAVASQANAIYSQSQGTSLSATVGGLPSNGNPVLVRLWYRTDSTWTTAGSVDATYASASSSGGGGSDAGGATAAPVMTGPAPGSTLSGASATFTWSPGSSATAYWLYVGHGAGAKDVLDSGAVGGALSLSVTGLPTDGSRLSVRLFYQTADGKWPFIDSSYTAATSAGGTGTVAGGAAGAPAITGPAPGSVLSGASATFTWIAGSGVTQYWLYVGHGAGAKDVFDSGSLGGSLSVNVTNLPTDGSTLFVRLFYQTADGKWPFIDSSYTAASSGRGTGSGAGGAAATPVMTGPVFGSTLSGASATFTWSAGSNATAYWLYVGHGAGAKDVFDSGNLARALSATVSNLPTDGSILSVRLFYQTADGKWPFVDTNYTAASSGGGTGSGAGGAAAKPVMTGPVLGSTLSGASATFTWNAGSNARAYWLYVGHGAGAKDVFDSGSLGGALSVNVTNLPTDGSALSVRLFYQTADGRWPFIDSSYTAAPR